jgi:hypothetical protein
VRDDSVRTVTEGNSHSQATESATYSTGGIHATNRTGRQARRALEKDRTQMTTVLVLLPWAALIFVAGLYVRDRWLPHDHALWRDLLQISLVAQGLVSEGVPGER